MAFLSLLATLTFGITVSSGITFTAGPPIQGNSTLVANPASVTANGAARISLTFKALDAYNNPVPGTAVNLSASGGNSVFAALSGATDANGIFVTSLTSTQAQTETVTAAFGNGLYASTTAQFVSGAAATSASQPLS